MATASNITFDAAVSPIKQYRTIITTPSLPEITNDTIMPQSSLQEVCMAIKLQMEVDLAQQYRAFFKELDKQPSTETVKSYIQMATETAQTAVTSQLQGTVITDITRRMNEMRSENYADMLTKCLPGTTIRHLRPGLTGYQPHPEPPTPSPD